MNGVAGSSPGVGPVPRPASPPPVAPRGAALLLLWLLLIGLADPQWPTFLVGGVLVAAAWAVRLWAFGHLDKNQLLVTTGPYAHVRNPAYFGTYGEFDIVQRYLDDFVNLFPVGRNGMHRYNNQDHSMLTAMLSVENIFGASHDIWQVNVEEDYHEEITK